eukprot:TRINITY_DN2804_c0_g1_i3.p1 TRINITY_DN2804_c0_g1~~TRINITY_DN2804_c0_g1_i3.p1  ORF type:complete len:977 (+),score=62.34 TRINITY_DN2804_c0_g1_i3:158-2932(+)
MLNPRAMASKRLLRDLKEVLEEPLPNISARPLEDNLFLWHGNVQGTDGPFYQVPIHFTLHFPDDYPLNPPQCRISTRVPHPNIRQIGAGYRLALWDCIPFHSTWSVAYTVQSILIQLQQFLLADELQYNKRLITIENAVKQALELKIPEVNHTGDKPWPAFPTEEEIERSKSVKKIVKLPSVPKRNISNQPKSTLQGNSQWKTVVCRNSKKSQQAPQSSNVSQPAQSTMASTSNQFQILQNLSQSTPATQNQKPSASLKPKIVKIALTKENLKNAANGGPHKEWIQEVIKEWEERRANQNNIVDLDEYPDIPPNHQKSMGLFGRLSVQNIMSIMCLLNPKDLSALSMSCKGLNSLSESGEIWQSLVRTHYPGSKLQASHISEYKHMFMLELNNVVGEMTCFFTRQSIEEQNVVLGLPYRYTINPKTELIDYIDVDSELLSIEAFEKFQVHTNITGEEIQGVLPLYLSSEHFKRALPYLPNVLRKLTLGKCSSPKAWLEVLPKIMNTRVVLLCDKGIGATEKSLITYNYLQRLLLSICEQYDLWDEVDSILGKALRTEEGRSKQALPNIGNILPLIGVSRRYSWKDCAKAFIEESFDRSVLWACKNEPSIIKKYSTPPIVQNVDEELIDLSFKGSMVAKRLMMFHVAFLFLVAKPASLCLEEVMNRQDSLYGRPSRSQMSKFNKAVITILGITSYNQFFRFIGVTNLDPKQLTLRLRLSWQRSLEKQYHTKTTNFSRIHSQGVSKILLKGETYTTPPNIKQINMEERWGWAGDVVKYLDASCLLFGKDRQFLEAVDYSHTTSHVTAPFAINHSGDILDHEYSEGLHTISINLKALPQEVESMYIVMSSWAGAKLDNIKQPFVSLVDPATNTSLCDYHLEDLKKEVACAASSVIMCRIYRREQKLVECVSSGSGWLRMGWKLQCYY